MNNYFDAVTIKVLEFLSEDGDVLNLPPDEFIQVDPRTGDGQWRGQPIYAVEPGSYRLFN